MPTLNWIGKDKVVTHHQEVPYRVLEHQYGFRADNVEDTSETRSGNMVIHGDNLEALKALMPQYEGRIKCIYIDPPYNTGNEKWVYNDNVNDPKIKKWLGEVVGQQGEDFSRHDKWLCMMYPRLTLLHKLLAEDGVIFISIDDNEYANLKLLCDEIFGANNLVETIIWKNKYGAGAKTIGFIGVHEYILMYSKNGISDISSELSLEMQAAYNKRDEHYEIRGGYFTQPLMTNSLDDRPNLQYTIEYNGDIIYPRKQWVWSKDRLLAAIANDEIVFSKQKDGTYSVRAKQYLKDNNGTIRKGKPISIQNGPFTQDGTSEIKSIFDKEVFKFSKPSELVRFLISLQINFSEDKNYIVLDSFAGSGTTAHAVLNQNKADGGDRKFILIEMMDYANDLTAERIRRVMAGYGEGAKAVEGTGGEFDYYELGAPLFKDNLLNEEVDEERIREYIYYSETKNPLTRKRAEKAKYLLDTHNGTSYYLYYKKGDLTTLSYDSLNIVIERAEAYVIYADICTIPEEVLTAKNITFKKIPRDIKRV